MEEFVLGMVQGVAEWLPVSSEGLVLLVKSNFFPSGGGLLDLVRLSLFLHLGTFLAALVYLRREVWQLLDTALHYRESSTSQRSLLKFLALATATSGLLGILLLQFFVKVFAEVRLLESARWLTLLIGFLLLGTAALQLFAKRVTAPRTTEALNLPDALLVGAAQGLAVLPGLSRSGLTVAALLLRRYEESLSLRLSFLLSLPIVLAGNLMLNHDFLKFEGGALGGLLAAFGFGWLTIHFLLRLAERFNFGRFVFLFAVLVLISAVL